MARKPVQANAAESDTIEVVALQMGYHGDRRIKPGQTFRVPKGLFGKWFTPVKPEDALAAAPSDEGDLV